MFSVFGCVQTTSQTSKNTKQERQLNSDLKRFRGRFVISMMQHPLINDFESKQYYFRPSGSDYGEWIVIVKDSKNLNSKISELMNKEVYIIGKDSSIDLGGKPATKNSYGNTVIFLDSIEEL